MYSTKNIAYILTSLESIEKIYIYTKDINGPEEFIQANDQLNFNACQALLMVIGEETKKIETSLKDKFSEIPWNQIASMRNRITHDYRSLNPEISFDIIENYLGDLKDCLTKMVGLISYPREKLERVVNTDYYKHLKYLLEEE
ncbi:MAG: HepT-like ribonuclease domain-containing protein [Saprospiraceae bacterium]